MLVCGHLEKSLDILTNEFNFDEREIILEKFVMAKSLWSCRTCMLNESSSSATAISNVVELVLSGYIECRLCRHWFHRLCCSEQLSNMEDSSNDLNFVCENCTKLFVIQVQTDEAASATSNNIVHHIKQVGTNCYDLDGKAYFKRLITITA